MMVCNDRFTRQAALSVRSVWEIRSPKCADICDYPYVLCIQCAYPTGHLQRVFGVEIRSSGIHGVPLDVAPRICTQHLFFYSLKII